MLFIYMFLLIVGDSDRKHQIFISLSGQRPDQARADGGIEQHDNFFIIDSLQRVGQIFGIEANDKITAFLGNDNLLLDGTFL